MSEQVLEQISWFESDALEPEYVIDILSDRNKYYCKATGQDQSDFDPDDSPYSWCPIDRNANYFPPIVASFNSYLKHFGQNITQAATDDVLGQCLEALKDVVSTVDSVSDPNDAYNRARRILAMTGGGE